MRMKIAILGTACSLLAGPALAQKAALPTLARPAVDGINLKVETVTGSSSVRTSYLGRDSSASVGFAGALSVPLGQSFGLQIDGLLGASDGRFAAGGASHVFWRNPDVALVGVYGSLTRRGASDTTNTRLGIEGQYYLSRFTVGGIAGYERSASDFVTTLPEMGAFASVSKSRGFAALDVSWYATDNFKLALGYRNYGGVNALAAGLEYMVQTGQGAAYAFFAEGRAGESRYLAGMAGLRVYVGQKDKSLIRRHREDDPPNYSPEQMLAPRGVATRAPAKKELVRCCVEDEV